MRRKAAPSALLSAGARRRPCGARRRRGWGRGVAAFLQRLAPRDGGPGTEPQPRDEVLLRGEGGEVGADLGQDDLDGTHAEPIDACQIHPRATPEGGACVLVVTARDGLLLGGIGMRGRRVIVPVGRRQGGQLLKQARLVGGDHLGQCVKELQGRGKIEDMLVAPGAGEVLRARRLRLATPPIPQRREPSRVALARDDGPNNRQPRRAGEVGDGAVDLDVHLTERLLHPLHAARPVLRRDSPSAAGRLAAE